MKIFILFILIFHKNYSVYSFDFSVVDSDTVQALSKEGQTQYELLQKNSLLPRYGTCWLSTIEDVNEGCKRLSEETQSLVALRLTNCFLDMSGHETYICDRKLATDRAACIHTMSDRAFSVYTTFYTHTHNMCWFLRGQRWHEAIIDGALRVAHNLETSVEGVRNVIAAQQESLQLQEQLLGQGRLLGSALENLQDSASNTGQTLRLLTSTLDGLHEWVVGEVSWLNSVIFYLISILLAVTFTTTKRTASARLLVLTLLALNFLTERGICTLLAYNTEWYRNITKFTWYCRYLFLTLVGSSIVFCAYKYRDLMVENHKYLEEIFKKTNHILSSVHKLVDVQSTRTNNEHSINITSNKSFDGFNRELSTSTSVLNGTNNTHSTTDIIHNTVHNNGNGVYERSRENSVCKGFETGMEPQKALTYCSSPSVKSNFNVQQINTHNSIVSNNDGFEGESYTVVSELKNDPQTNRFVPEDRLLDYSLKPTYNLRRKKTSYVYR